MASSARLISLSLGRPAVPLVVVHEEGTGFRDETVVDFHRVPDHRGASLFATAEKHASERERCPPVLAVHFDRRAVGRERMRVSS